MPDGPASQEPLGCGGVTGPDQPQLPISTKEIPHGGSEPGSLEQEGIEVVDGEETKQGRRTSSWGVSPQARHVVESRAVELLAQQP